MTAGLPLMKSVLLHLAKKILPPLGVMAGTSAKCPAIQKKVYGSGTARLLFSNEEFNIIK